MSSNSLRRTTGSAAAPVARRGYAEATEPVRSVGRGSRHPGVVAVIAGQRTIRCSRLCSLRYEHGLRDHQAQVRDAENNEDQYRHDQGELKQADALFCAPKAHSARPTPGLYGLPPESPE